MPNKMPGAVVELDKDSRMTGSDYLSSIFSLTSGLMLCQVREITGLDTSTLQNWVKRGFVSNPVNKRYSINQVSRILIINMLRDTMQLEKIVQLLSILNGQLDDETDDTISDARLYDYLCRLSLEYNDLQYMAPKQMDESIARVTSDYEEVKEGAGDILRKALKIILLAYIASQKKRQAEIHLAGLAQEAAPSGTLTGTW